MKSVPTTHHAIAHTQQSAESKTVKSRVINHKNALFWQHRKDAAVMGSKPRRSAKPID
jgi:hypothetical protein